MSDGKRTQLERSEGGPSATLGLALGVQAFLVLGLGGWLLATVREQGERLARIEERSLTVIERLDRIDSSLTRGDSARR